jgi:signal transduction histidine kinase
VRASLALNGDWAEFTLSDNGVGLGGSAKGAGHGLQNMRERAAALGGTLEMTGAAGEGTAVRVRLPCLGARREAKDSKGL